MSSFDEARAYIVGGGIASLSAAVLLIRDGGLQGRNIRIIEELLVAGGALDGSGDPVNGYVTRLLWSTRSEAPCTPYTAFLV